jgi:hypothetical protein
MSRCNRQNVSPKKDFKGSSLVEEDNEEAKFKMSMFEEIIKSLEYIVARKVDNLYMIGKVEFQDFKYDVKEMGNLHDRKDM